MQFFKKIYNKKKQNDSADPLPEHEEELNIEPQEILNVEPQEELNAETEVEPDNSPQARFLQNMDNYLEKVRKVTIPNLDFPVDRAVHFKHSGNAGDIIYAIPAMKAIAQQQPICLHLFLNKPAGYAEYMKHPLGNVTLTQKMFDMLYPLLMAQPQFQECKVLDDENTVIDADLDLIRDYPMLLDRGNIARWYFLIFPVNFDLNEAWLKVEPDIVMKDSIVLARSNRYQAPNIDYSILAKYPNVYFVGVEDEYIDMKQIIPNLKYRPVNNFLEMSSVIAGSKLFIGNQSFPFSLAEALKVNRLLEVYFECPNVTAYGDKGFDFSFQPQFEKLLKLRYEMI